MTDTASTPLDARASDPVTMGWMMGSPPPAERLIRWADGSWFRFPRTRWAYSHISQLMPTGLVSRGTGPISPLPRADRTDLDAVTFLPIGRSEPMTWAASLEANYTDGIVILHRGRVVSERYFGVLTPDRAHIAFSVTKSFVATLAASLLVEGTLDETRRVVDYLPELAASAIGSATLRQVLDMTTGLDHGETYTDPASPVWALSRAAGFLARPADDRGPGSLFEYLQTLRPSVPHGQRFAYCTVNTDTLGAILSRVTGRSLPTLLSERIFGKLGAEHDASFTVDPTGAAWAGAGLCLTLRDLARFGELMRLEGRWQGAQLVPAAAIADIRRGGDQAKFVPAGYQTLPGWSYRSMWWVSHNEHGAYMGRGIHGQAVYIDPAAEMVIARFASHPLAANANLDPTSLPAYHAVAKRLLAA